MELFTVIVTVAVVLVVQAQQFPIVDKSVIADGGTFTVTCDITRFASTDIPSIAPYISELSLERTVGTSPRTLIVSYVPLAPPGFQNLTTNIPPGRNWLIEATGGLSSGAISTNNKNTIKITLVVKDATCADAGIYRCNASYLIQQSGPGKVDRFQNITAKANTEDPVFTLDHQNGLETDVSKNAEGANVFLSCKVRGPYGLVLSWLTGPKGGFSFSPYPTANDIQMVTPSPPSPTANPCTQYNYDTILNITVELGETMYICVVTDSSNVEVIRKNFTIDGKPTSTQTPDGGQSSDPETSGANVGAIVGGVIGGLVLIAIIVIVVYFCWYRKRNDDDSGRDKEFEATDATHAPPPVFYAEPKKVKKDERDGVTSVETWDKPSYEEKGLYTNHGDFPDNEEYPPQESRGGRKGKKNSAHNNPSYMGDSPRMQENHYASTDVSRSEDESDVPLEKPKPKRRSRTPTHDQRENQQGLHYAVLDIQQPRRGEQPEKNSKYEEVPVQYAEIQV